MLLLLFAVAGPRAEPAERTQWRGYTRYNFVLNGRRAALVEPAAAAADKPWVWRTELFGTDASADQALLAAGWHLAWVDLQNLYGNRTALGLMDAAYALWRRDYGLSPRAVLEALDRGSLAAFAWGAAHPGQVRALLADSAVGDVKHWPGAHGQGGGSALEWTNLLGAYGVTEDKLAGLSPLDQLAPLAAARVPLLLLAGGADEELPPVDHAAKLAASYRQLGGPARLVLKPLAGHRPFGLRNPAPLVHWLDRGEWPALATPNGYDYWVPRDGLARCRAKFAKEGTGRVLFVGGRATWGEGWRELVGEELRRRCPGARLEVRALGAPGLGSLQAACALAPRLATAPPDLLFVDTSGGDAGARDVRGETLRALEGLVRAARVANPAVDIVLVYTADPLNQQAWTEQHRLAPVLAAHEEVAAHYGLPSVDLSLEVAERLLAREYPDPAAFIGWPLSPLAHRVAAATVGRLLADVWRGAPLAEVAPAPPLPEPLDERYLPPVRVLPLETAQVDESWRRESTPAGPTLGCDVPGASLKLKFTGRALVLWVEPGRDGGTLEYRLDGGASGLRDLYAPARATADQVGLEVLATDLAPGPHELEVKVERAANPRSRGHAIRLVACLTW